MDHTSCRPRVIVDVSWLFFPRALTSSNFVAQHIDASMSAMDTEFGLTIVRVSRNSTGVRGQPRIDRAMIVCHDDLGKFVNPFRHILACVSASRSPCYRVVTHESDNFCNHTDLACVQQTSPYADLDNET